VLESGRGPVPNIAEWMRRNVSKGSWWGHRRGSEIFSCNPENCAAHERILVCRLVDRKITFVHRRLWPTLLVWPSISQETLAALYETHTQLGKHEIIEVPLAEWVPKDILKRSSNDEKCTPLPC